MSDIKEFSHFEKAPMCRKCGRQETISLSFCNRRCWNVNITPKLPWNSNSNEHLHCRCMCGYHWLMAPWDSTREVVL